MASIATRGSDIVGEAIEVDNLFKTEKDSNIGIRRKRYKVSPMYKNSPDVMRIRNK